MQQVRHERRDRDEDEGCYPPRQHYLGAWLFAAAVHTALLAKAVPSATPNTTLLSPMTLFRTCQQSSTHPQLPFRSLPRGSESEPDLLWIPERILRLSHHVGDCCHQK